MLKPEQWMIPIGERITQDVKDDIGMRALKCWVDLPDKTA